MPLLLWWLPIQRQASLKSHLTEIYQVKLRQNYKSLQIDMVG